MVEMNLSLANIQGVGVEGVDPAPAIYVAGPMIGYPNFNFGAFFETSEAFEDGGWIVFNPAQHDIEVHGSIEGVNAAFEKDKDGMLRDCLSWDMMVIAEYCDAIAMLPGWENSKGARAEHALAVALDLEIIYLS